MGKGKKLSIIAVSAFLSLFTIAQIHQHGMTNKTSEGREEKEWIASSSSWVERKSCEWFGICGATHLNKAHWVDRSRKGKLRAQKAFKAAENKFLDFSDFWTSGKARPEDWDEDERVLRDIPQYVLEHAPLVHLFSGEKFWPCDIAEHLIHTTPHLNYTPVQARSDHPNLTDLDDLNRWGRFVYLKSDDNVEERPDWLGGSSNIPSFPDRDDGDVEYDDGSEWRNPVKTPVSEDMQDWYEAGIGDTRDKGGVRPAPTSLPGFPSQSRPITTTEGEELIPEHPPAEKLHRRSNANPSSWTRGKQTVGGRSDAPAVLVVVDKGHGVVDAFWFYFYSYNLGNVVLNVRFGNHVGDWEHSVVRFHNGKPKAVFFSEHSFGEAYSWNAVEKVGKRPVGYIATGTHAMYATPGTHSYILPWGLLHDVTDRGPLWDPVLNMHAYTYDYISDNLRSSILTPKAPTSWFYFLGHWGDKFYPLSDKRQYRFAGQYHYVNGPLGPRFKNLGRKRICQGNGECLVKDSLEGGKARRGEGEGERR
ncbi:hypothetical protein K490DRAFT_39142 [Saccharata proteae CBS 121410]|uniref:Vacuolar protein sorting-associated protein TDA6 n=1 Tax=Saccharata proteae CBS 121410 TaxID=1314787 RepID=A0A9P4HY67_9PEZI|nr:hypothetical protein K490DRAFT_39142 [Saccharata proteae CBS 121410]